jgi:phage terminase large subunit GpA-like protein
VSHLYKSQQKKLAKKVITSLPTEIVLPTITEWAEQNRYYPPGVSSFYGMHKASTAPHMVEPLENLHPDSPIQWTSIMKSVQSTATTTAECAIGFYIRYKLANMGYYTATQELARIRGSANIDTMIDNSGLAEYVKPHSNRNSRKKADSALYKEFSGGIKLQLNSYNSIGGMKSNTIHFMILDEIDEMPEELKGQGDTLSILEGRTIAVRNPKVLVISTPTAMETSKISRLFIEGDQRYYHVPCPLCGEKQKLVLKSGDLKHGLTFNTEKNRDGEKKLIPETVRYICEHCGKEFYESNKQWMLENGIWIPEAESKNPLKRSYHVNGLYSPQMFLSWERICQQYTETGFGQDILRFKDFTINYLGLPWSRVEKHESWEYVRDKADEYALGDLPDGGLILYGGVDVQGDRVELCVIAVGRGMESWIIDYKIFYGNPGSLSDPCYIALDTFVRTQTYIFSGRKLPIRMVGMDTGYDPKHKRPKDWDSKSNTIYQFVGPRQDKFRAIKGFPDIQSNFDLIQQSRITAGLLTVFYKINTPMMKEMIYKDITIVSGPRAIHFPKYRIDNNGSKRYIGDEFYKQFMSERYQEMSPGVMGWKKIRSRNEVLDTYLYAKSMAYQDNLHVWTDNTWDKYKKGLMSK